MKQIIGVKVRTRRVEFPQCKTDVLVVATSSNLGAYGVCAALAIARRKATRPPTPYRESAWWG